jgi:hypothetical protein
MNSTLAMGKWRWDLTHTLIERFMVARHAVSHQLNIEGQDF